MKNIFGRLIKSPASVLFYASPLAGNLLFAREKGPAALVGLPATRNDLRRMGVDYLFWGDDERHYFKFDPDLPVVIRIDSTVIFSEVKL